MAEGLVVDPSRASVFALRDDAGWRRWRERKLAARPADVSALVVEVRDPARLSEPEREAIVERLRRANMAIYATRTASDDPRLPRHLAAQLGLRRLDAPPLAERDGVTRIAFTAAKARDGFIPYTDRRMLWHTDGYYNPPERRVRAMLLHCVRPAARGGESLLADHEIAWLRLREAGAPLVEALMAPDALTIPARVDADGIARAAVTGPVFSIDASGDLHLRFTARRRSVEWKRDAVVSEAAARLAALLDAECVRIRLEAGMGIVCNNVPHGRAMFEDDPRAPRLLLRARYLERVAGTEGAWTRPGP